MANRSEGLRSKARIAAFAAGTALGTLLSHEAPSAYAQSLPGTDCTKTYSLGRPHIDQIGILHQESVSKVVSCGISPEEERIILNDLNLRLTEQEKNRNDLAIDGAIGLMGTLFIGTVFLVYRGKGIRDFFS